MLDMDHESTIMPASDVAMILKAFMNKEGEQDQKIIQTMENLIMVRKDIEHLVKSFDEFKEDQRRYHITEGIKSEKFEDAITRIMGSIANYPDMRMDVEANTNFRILVQEDIKEMIADRKDNKKRMKDVLWKVGTGIAWFILFLYTIFANSVPPTP